MKNMMVLRAPVIIWSIHYPSLSAMFDSLHSSTNQELLEKHICNKSSHYEKYAKEAIMCNHQINAFHCQQDISKDKWNTKENTGKSLKNVLHILRYAKRHLSGWSDNEQWKNQAASLSRSSYTGLKASVS